jgi:hypothetical protein
MKVLVFSHYFELAKELISAGSGVGEVSLLLTSDQADREGEVKGAKRVIICDVSSEDQQGLLSVIASLS